MEASNFSLLLLFFFIFTLSQTSIIATKKSYIVYLGSESSSSLDPFSLSGHSKQVTTFHYDLLGSLLGSKKMAEEAIFYSYTRSFNGFAAKLEEKEAADLARNPKVISVFENKARKLHTTRSWNFLGVENDVGIPSNSIWNAAKFGQDIIIANMDTGVWPESKSFSDEGYGPVPSKWRGICQTDSTFHCNRQFCGEGTLDPMKVKGKIVICQTGEIEGVDKSYQAARAGAVGVIVANDIEKGDEIYPQLHFLPASDITNTDAQLLQTYLKSTTNPMAHLTKVKTQLNIKPAPVIATFSSRGPNPISPSILKPDIIAPGVNILASYPTGNAPSLSSNDRRRIPFNVISGTSMSCPHVAGIAALLKSIHPNWSPAAIKSAIMTTAKTRGNNLQTILDSTKLKATSYAYGAGLVYPNNAMDPGLVYDTTVDDYLNFLCARGYNAMEIKKFYAKPFSCVKSFKVTDLNYPSISVGKLKIGAPVTINRRVKNVGSPGTYVASVKASPGVAVSVEPSTLQFSNVDEEKAFKVVLQNTGKVKRGDVFGTLIWSDGKHFVRSPITVHLGS
ncbi:unnamed protein product [Citrullus colocynthis]|uniref:Subtilisin-like protease SBT5.3 n=1 Tax=Citrullus colocynthis TaxID=252529 RepID=A0ABP0YRN9_9ROSI